jgi:ABC-type Fe3+/spermidine/putrescine transport system ATPase subunit
MERAPRQRLALAVLEKVGLAGYRDRLVGRLSTAQRQLAALAQGLITQPAVVLLDDPLANLERIVRLQLRGEFRLIQQELGITFVHATHSQEEALALADLVAVMEKGQILRTSTHQPVF